MIKCTKCGNDAIIKTLNDDFEGIYTCKNSACRFRFTETTLKETKMQSNTKLSKFEKSLFKTMQKKMPDVKFATMGKTTIAFKHVGDNVEFATAICADTEKKNRPKVGKYWAMTRFEYNQTVKMPFTQFDNMVESAFWD
jgi:hypothetical protein